MLGAVAVHCCSNLTSAVNQQSQNKSHISAFCRYLHNNRCKLGEADWTEFCQKLSSQIAASCKKLQKEMIAELHAQSMTPRSDSSEGSSSSSPPSFAMTSSFASLETQRQGSIEPLPAANEALQDHQSLQPLRNSAGGLIASPLCLQCRKKTSRSVTKPKNYKGNAFRPFYKCNPCDIFHCFDDTHGIDPTNPLCHCGYTSRRQVDRREGDPERGCYLVCGVGGCTYRETEKNATGELRYVDPATVNQMRRSNLV